MFFSYIYNKVQILKIGPSPNLSNYSRKYMQLPFFEKDRDFKAFGKEDMRHSCLWFKYCEMHVDFYKREND